MPVNTIADYRPLFKIAKDRGFKVAALFVNPASMVDMVKEITGIGENPFPNCQRTWKRFWRKPDVRVFLFGVPVVPNPLIPVRLVGVASVGLMPLDLADMFKGDLKIGPEPQSLPERGVMQMLSDSVNGESASMTDLMFKAMENVDSANGLIVLRFWGDRFDVTTSYTPLEVQAVLQRTSLRIMSDGLHG